MLETNGGTMITENDFLESLLIIPEEIIKHCANQVSDSFPEEANNFKLCLEYGEKFRTAGLTPIYLCKENMKDVFVTSMEKYQNKFH